MIIFHSLMAAADIVLKRARSISDVGEQDMVEGTINHSNCKEGDIQMRNVD
jgi:hypothetical protein